MDHSFLSRFLSNFFDLTSMERAIRKKSITFDRRIPFRSLVPKIDSSLRKAKIKKIRSERRIEKSVWLAHATRPPLHARSFVVKYV